MAEIECNSAQEEKALSMEDLSKKVQEATQELNQLKNGLNVLSLQEKSDRLVELEASILDCSENLAELEADSEISIDKKKLESLRSKINTLESNKELLKQQIESKTKAEIQVLNQSFAQHEGQPGGGEHQGKTEKGRFGRQREGLVSKQEWKEHTGKNILRTLGGVGLVGGVVLGLKKLFTPRDYESEIPGYSEMSRKEKRLARKNLRKEKRAERKKERRENGEGRPRWQKFLIGSVIAGGTVIGGVEIYKHRNKISSWVKEKLGLALNFDQAKQKVEDEVRNGKIDDDHFGAFNSNFEGGITYNEDSQELCSYGEKTKIDKKNKKLQGLAVEFASYEEMIHAANIVNFAKRKLKGRGATSRPFMQTEWGGDIAFNCSGSGSQEFLSGNNSNEWSWILGTLGTVGGGLLGGYCAGAHGAAIGGVSGGLTGYALGAYIDNTSAAGRCCSTIARGKNFDLFLMYLNSQTDENGKSLWESAGEEYIAPDGSPINGLVDNGERENMGAREGILAEIEKEYGEDQTGRRKLNILWEESKPTEYTIESFGHRVKLTIEGGPTKKGDDIDYSKITKIHIEKYRDSDWGDGLDIDFPKTKEGLEEAIRTANLTNMFREDWAGKGREDYSFSCGRFIGTDGKSLYFDAGEFYGKGTRLLDRETLKEKYPTIFKDVTSERIMLSNHQKEYHKQAINDESTGSQYIKFLHQMGKGKYWKKI